MGEFWAHVLRGAVGWQGQTGGPSPIQPLLWTSAPSPAGENTGLALPWGLWDLELADIEDLAFEEHPRVLQREKAQDRETPLSICQAPAPQSSLQALAQVNCPCPCPPSNLLWLPSALGRRAQVLSFIFKDS